MRQPAIKQEMLGENFLYNTALYMRLSRDDGDSGESESIINQRKILYAYAMEMGFNVVGEYVDDGWSGTSFQRPGFQQMIKDIDDKEINCIVTKDLSRLGRDHVMTGYYIESFFPENNIRCIAINDKVDSEEGDNDITPFMNVFNEFHAKQTSKKIRRVFEVKFGDGECHYIYPPMGYNKDPEVKNHLVPDPETRWIVEKMFELAEEGKGPWVIRSWLYDHKVMTPGYRAYLRWGAYAKVYDGAPESRRYEWGLKSVKEILKNPLYIGTLVHYRKRTISYKNHKAKNLPENKQIVYENAHEPIISKERFDRVQELIGERKRKSKQSGKPHVFAGIAVCADCGGGLRFGSNRTSPNHTYNYLCCSRKNEVGTKSCTSHYTNYDRLCSAVLERIQSLYREVHIDKEAILKRLRASVAEHDETRSSSSKEEKASLEKRKAELENILSKLYEDWAAQRITEDMFSAMTAKFRTEYTELTQRLDQLSDAQEKPEKKEDGRKLVELIDQMSYPTELTSELVNLLISRIEIHEPIGGHRQKFKPQEIEIFWRFVEPEHSELFFK